MARELPLAEQVVDCLARLRTYEPSSFLDAHERRLAGRTFGPSRKCYGDLGERPAIELERNADAVQ
jgi:hypothetical protein